MLKRWNFLKTGFYEGIKHEMTFGANGRLVLVHQLIRQYVMAKILMDRLESDGLAKKNV